MTTRCQGNLNPRWRSRLRRAVTALVFGVSLVPGAAHAGNVTLDEIIRRAATSSLSLRQADEKVAGAEGRLQQAEGAFDWSGSAETGFQKLYGPSSSNGFLTTNTASVEAWRNVVGFHRLFRNGIDVQPGVIEYPNPGVTPGQTFGVTKPRPVLGLGIPLLRGRGEEAADAAEIAAREALQGTELNRAFTQQRIVHDAVSTFWRCLSGEQQQELLTTAVRDAKKNADLIRSLAGKGRIEPMAAEREAARQVSREQNAAHADLSVKHCERDLAQVSSDSSDDPLATPAGEWPEMPTLVTRAAALDTGALTDLAIANRLDLQALEHIASG